jgi:tape measure domain-containing protein
MSGVDQRIVEMSFKGDTFLSGVKNAISALLSLKNGLNGLKGSEKDLNNLDDAGKKFSLKGISDQLDSIKSKFSLMHVAAITAFTNIVNRGVDAGISLVKALTVDPIKAGLDVYETKINAIQTILANTSSEGTNLKQVTAALDQLNTYANKTVYNFGQMAQNIGTFTAAGVNLKTSVESIKGIANLAALSGSSAEQASTAMYQLSQAIAAGSVKLQDWNSVVNAGLGGKVFQNALEETARASGVSIDKIIAKAGSFRNSLQQGWLTSGILTKTLATFTGDLSVAQLKAMGFTNQEAAAIFKQGQIAVQSATQIRTITQLTSALKEEVATAWAAVFQAIIGNSVQAASTLSSLHNVAESALTTPIYALAKILQAFTDLGGRQVVIAAIEQAFKDLGAVLGVVKQAFDAVFGSGSGGAGTASKLVVMAGAVLKLTEALKPSKQTLAELKTIFEGVFSAVKIVIDVFSALIGSVGKVGGAATGAGGGFLSFIAKIAQFIVNVKNAIESGGALTKFFEVLGTIISLPIKALGAIIDALGGFSGAAGKAVSGASDFVSKIGSEFSKLSDAIINGIKSGDLSKIGTIINQLLLGGVLIQIKKFIQGLGKGGEGGGLFDSIKESFEGLTNALKAMQQSLKAETLEKIAIAVALLTVSLVALSFVNIGNLTKALTAMTVMFTELLGALAVVAKIAGSAGIVKMTVIGLALNELAAAILLLTVSVAILSRFSWSELTKGLSAIGILLTELAIATQLMASNTKGLIATAIAMEAMAVAINLMAVAVKILGSLDFGTLAKGIGSVAALLLVIVGFQKLAGGEQLISSAAGMILIGAALNIMAFAVARIGGLPFGTLVKGIAGVAAVLLILVVAMNAMNAGIAGAAAMVVGAAALLILANALNSLGAESWGAIGKALVLLAGSLIIIAGAMILMTEALPGAAALLVVAAALAVLTPILVTLGGLSWSAIAKGLLALAGVFLVIGTAGLLLGPLVPILLGLGAAIALLGVGMLAAGVGIGLFAVGLTALAVAVAASGVSILAFVKSVLSLIPTTLSEIGQGIVAFASAIGNGAAAIVGAFVKIIVSIADGLVKALPEVTKAVGSILTSFLTIVVQNTPKILAAFAKIMLDVLSNIATNMPKFVTSGINIVVNFLAGITKNVSKVAAQGVALCVAIINAIGSSTVKVVTAAVNMIISMVNGIANELRSKTPALQSAMHNLGSAIIEALVGAITGGLSGVVGAIEHVAESAINAAKSVLHINSPSKDFEEIGAGVMEGWQLGHLKNAHLVTGSLTTVAATAISTLKNSLSGMSNLISDSVDLQPKITPVIDLAQLRSGLSTMNSLTGASTLKANLSASTAASISSANQQAAAQAGLLAGGGTQLSFTQINNSPVALSAVDIYRQTKNQLSIARGALTGANGS